jgi:hypothetical protein
VGQDTSRLSDQSRHLTIRKSSLLLKSQEKIKIKDKQEKVDVTCDLSIPSQREEIKNKDKDETDDTLQRALLKMGRATLRESEGSIVSRGVLISRNTHEGLFSRNSVPI